VPLVVQSSSIGGRWSARGVRRTVERRSLAPNLRPDRDVAATRSPRAGEEVGDQFGELAGRGPTPWTALDWSVYWPRSNPACAPTRPSSETRTSQAFGRALAITAAATHGASSGTGATEGGSPGRTCGPTATRSLAPFMTSSPWTSPPPSDAAVTATAPAHGRCAGLRPHPGVVARCPTCDQVLLRMVRGPGRAWLTCAA
jgi:hypothetical protein